MAELADAERKSENLRNPNLQLGAFPLGLRNELLEV